MKSKDSSDSNAQKPAETETAATAPEKMAAQEKKATPGKNVAPKKVEETIIATASATPLVILQSPFGGEITVDAVKTLVGEVDKVYVRIDQNKLYWVKGEETGNKDIW